jgi:hypothetical protein
MIVRFPRQSLVVTVLAAVLAMGLAMISPISVEATHQRPHEVMTAFGFTTQECTPQSDGSQLCTQTEVGLYVVSGERSVCVNIYEFVLHEDGEHEFLGVTGGCSQADAVIARDLSAASVETTEVLLERFTGCDFETGECQVEPAGSVTVSMQLSATADRQRVNERYEFPIGPACQIRASQKGFMRPAAGTITLDGVTQPVVGNISDFRHQYKAKCDRRALPGGEF